MGPRARDVLAAPDRARRLECRLPVRHGAADHDRRRAGAGAPRHLCRRARLGAACARSSSPRSVYDALMAAGEPHGIANAGYRAIESLRLEKGYRAWGADIGPDHSPLVAGPRLGGEAEIEHAVPRAARRSKPSAAQAAAAAARRLHRRRSRDRAARPRDHLSRRRARRLAHQRRLRLHGRPARSATAMCATRRTGRSRPRCCPAATSSRSPTERVPAEVFLRSALRPGDAPGEGVSDDREGSIRSFKGMSNMPSYGSLPLREGV